MTGDCVSTLGLRTGRENVGDKFGHVSWARGEGIRDRYRKGKRWSICVGRIGRIVTLGSPPISVISVLIQSLAIVNVLCTPYCLLSEAVSLTANTCIINNTHLGSIWTM